jgi:catalase (peroxidase I)
MRRSRRMLAGEAEAAGGRPRRGEPQKFVHDFAAAWKKVMNRARFDVRSISAEKAVA